METDLSWPLLDRWWPTFVPTIVRLGCVAALIGMQRFRFTHFVFFSQDNILQVHATLALCKFMCVSSEFCETYLQLLFTILEKSNDPTIRSNIIIALGDMTVSFNSLIDQNISYLYKRLGDSDLTVKKNTLMVLTHLILNGMVKVKGQISEMAKCLEDEDSRISDLAKLFFTELATKDNAIYNNLPDIISNLSAEANGVDEETFQSIMAFLLEFIDKVRHSSGTRAVPDACI